MNHLIQKLNVRLSVPVVITIAVLSLACISYVEGTALDRATRKKPDKNVSCISCHKDKKTLAAIANKSGDDLYLVHSGELTVDQLKKLQNGSDSFTPWKPK